MGLSRKKKKTQKQTNLFEDNQSNQDLDKESLTPNPKVIVGEYVKHPPAPCVPNWKCRKCQKKQKMFVEQMHLRIDNVEQRQNDLEKKVNENLEKLKR